MRSNSFNDHIATEDGVVHADGNVTCRMPGQMDEFEWTELHSMGLIGEINGSGLVDGFAKTVEAEDMFAPLFRESCVAEERSKTTPNQREPGFMMRDRLNVQFMDSNPGAGNRSQ